MSKTYRLKPIEVKATQFLDEDTPLPEKVEFVAGNYYYHSAGGLYHIEFGDWIVDSPGQTRIMSDREFQRRFEEIPE